MSEERAIEELAMNNFPKNESKETLFALVSPEEALPQPSNPPKKTTRKICGSNYPLSIVFIVVNEFCERFSYYGMKAVLTLYFLYFLHWSEDTSTSVYHAFSSLCYFTPLIGAIMADSWLGRFRSIRKMAIGMILASLAFAAAATVEIKINETSPHKPGSKEIYLKILNLADDEVKLALMDYQNNPVFSEAIKPFQHMDHSKMLLTTESQSFYFQLHFHNTSVTSEHILEEKNRYSLVTHADQRGISSFLMKETITSKVSRMAAVRFINTLGKDVNITLNRDAFLIVGENYGISDYTAMERGKYHHVPCRTQGKDFTLDLGLLDFGAAYTVVIINSSDQGLRVWKTEDIPANQISIAWQLPQYALVTAGEIMFSITGLEFSYSQAPPSMKSVLQAAWLLTVAMGNIIVLIVAQTSALVQWAEFVLFSGLLLIVSFIFSIMGYYYIPVKPEDIYSLEDKVPSHIKGNMKDLEIKKTKL
uniref:Solute carrier family 15 member 2 n=1 Tax=Sarcophilus harrisii TaxID=9305 RepID=A0A7N4P0U5_SARHA